MGIEILSSPIEMPVELWINKKKTTTFMCSPYDLEDMAIGHLLTRGIIKNISAVEDIKIKKDTYQIFMTINEPVPNQLYTVPEFVLSGTTSVSEFSENIYKIPKIKSDYSVELEKIIRMAQVMVEEATIYKLTGGVHGAIVAIGDRYHLREDIGRHCAVDKAIGAAFKKKEDLSHAFICTTGRISLDMLLKSAAVGLSIVASLKYPSDMGIKLAQHYNIAIISGVLSTNPLVYACEDRVEMRQNKLHDLSIKSAHKFCYQ